jgi:hypothetical protein
LDVTQFVVEINTPVTLAYAKGGIIDVLPGNVSFSLIKGNTVTATPLPTQELVAGVLVSTFTPTLLGFQHLVVDGRVVGDLEVVPRSYQLSLSTLEDVALGSWKLDKSTKVLTLYTQQGAEMATYDVVDSVTETSREKL